MQKTYLAAERPHTFIGWLDSRHTFSFGEHHDPRRMGFRALRVVNDDRVAPGEGFGEHGHRDMEILSFVLDGALAHADSLGRTSTLRPGDVQRMSAGSGVRHSEFNGSTDEAVHFLQIWILPEKRGLAPSYEQKHFPLGERRGRLRLIASRDARDGSLAVNQDVFVYTGVLAPGDRVGLALEPGRHAFVHVARGALLLGGRTVVEGDGVAVSDERELTLTAEKDAEVLVFDLA